MDKPEKLTPDKPAPDKANSEKPNPKMPNPKKPEKPKKPKKSKETRLLQASIGVFFLLVLLFVWECGYITVPSFFTPSPTVASTSVGTAVVGMNPVDDNEVAEQAKVQDCMQTAFDNGGYGYFCETPRQLAASRKYYEEVTKPWVKSHWPQEATGFAMLISLITIFVFYFRWSDARKKAKMVVLADGRVIVAPPHNPTKAKLIMPGDPRFAARGFEAIIGQKVAVRQIQEYLDFVKNPEKFESRGIKIPRGVLLYGWHGTGKTLVVGTLAAECTVPILLISGSHFIEQFVGVGASRVRELYDFAEKVAAIYGWCFIFIDEVDGIGGTRGSGAGGGNQEHDQTINQLLDEMEGVIQRDRVITFAATNLKQKLDPALLRRFKRQYEFMRPSRSDRRKLFEHYLPLEWRGEDINLDQVVKVTPGATGSDIQNICNEAKIKALQANLEKVNAKLLDDAILDLQMGLLRDKSDGLLTPAEQEIVDIHEAGHAVVSYGLTGKAPERCTNVPRGQTGGHVQFSEDGEFMKTEEAMKRHIAIAMGGWAATLLECGGQKDSGPSGDFESATTTSIEMVTAYGMSDLGFISLRVLEQARLVSDKFRDEVRARIDQYIEEGKNTALRVIKENLPLLRKLVAEVREHEVLLADDFEALVKNMPKAQKSNVIPLPRSVRESDSRVVRAAVTAVDAAVDSLPKRLSTSLVSFAGRFTKKKKQTVGAA